MESKINSGGDIKNLPHIQTLSAYIELLKLRKEEIKYDLFIIEESSKIEPITDKDKNIYTLLIYELNLINSIIKLHDN